MRNGGARPVGYTTTLKMMQIMSDKGLVERDDPIVRTFTAPRPARSGRCSGN